MSSVFGFWGPGAVCCSACSVSLCRAAAAGLTWGNVVWSQRPGVLHWWGHRHPSWGAVGEMSLPQRLTSGYHGRRADQSGKRLCAAPWSKVKVWSDVLNTGARNSQFRIPVHPLSVLPHFCCEAVPDLTEISRSDLGLPRCSWDQSQISIWPLCLAHRYNNPPLSSRINYWSQKAFSFFLFTQRALYNYYYSFILFSILLLASGLLLSQSLSDQEGGCLQLSAERDYFN